MSFLRSVVSDARPRGTTGRTVAVAAGARGQETASRPGDDSGITGASRDPGVSIPKAISSLPNESLLVEPRSLDQGRSLLTPTVGLGDETDAPPVRPSAPIVTPRQALMAPHAETLADPETSDPLSSRRLEARESRAPIPEDPMAPISSPESAGPHAFPGDLPASRLHQVDEGIGVRITETERDPDQPEAPSPTKRSTTLGRDVDAGGTQRLPFGSNAFDISFVDTTDAKMSGPARSADTDTPVTAPIRTDAVPELPLRDREAPAYTPPAASPTPLGDPPAFLENRRAAEIPVSEVRNSAASADAPPGVPQETTQPTPMSDVDASFPATPPRAVVPSSTAAAVHPPNRPDIKTAALDQTARSRAFDANRDALIDDAPVATPKLSIENATPAAAAVTQGAADNDRASTFLKRLSREAAPAARNAKTPSANTPSRPALPQTPLPPKGDEAAAMPRDIYRPEPARSVDAPAKTAVRDRTSTPAARALPRSQTPRPAPQAPTVQIGRIDVVIQAPKPTSRKPAAAPAVDLASRHFLRRL